MALDTETMIYLFFFGDEGSRGEEQVYLLYQAREARPATSGRA